MKHVVITGGAGFIGSHLCDLFLSRGYAVTAVDNFLTGRMENLAKASRHPQFSFLKKNVCDFWTSPGTSPRNAPRKLEDAWDEKDIPWIAKYGLSGVLHFACPASPIDFDRIPFEILEVDSVGTMATVSLALRHRCRYLLASTSEVYGDPLVHPQTESYWGNVNPNGPRACYDETKRFGEAYVSTATRLKELNGSIVRIFNTYGPRMRIDDGRVVPELCRQAIQREPLTVHGEGRQTRSFCYVSDLIEGIFRLFESDVHDPVNIGNPEEYSIIQFAEAVQKIQGSRLPIQHLASRVDDPKKRCPNIQRAKSLLKWEPRVGLEEGLKLSLEYFRTQV